MNIMEIKHKLKNKKEKIMKNNLKTMSINKKRLKD